MWEVAIVMSTLGLMLMVLSLFFVVSKHSLKLKEIVALNQLYRNIFDDMDRITPKQYKCVCKSKAALNRLNLRDYAISEIDQRLNNYTELMQMIGVCESKYNQYLMKRKNIIENTALEIHRNFITRGIENILLSYHFPKLRNRLQMRIVATYTSPKGRNHYSRSVIYSSADIKSLYQQATQRREQKKSCQYQMKIERAKMSDSLRYDVLKRDDFRCRICGASSRDGVQLHVDHIHPVSKGGKTTLSNLQTLCDRCNIGKSNKI